MATWQDTTSYSQGERGNVYPREWTISSRRIRLTVHRLHDIPGRWFATCHEVGIVKKDLHCQDVEDAKVKAVDAIGRHLTAMLADVVQWEKGAGQ